MYRIRVPATTANMGPGFDSAGMAFSLYNYTEIYLGTDNGKQLDIRVKPPDKPRQTLDWYDRPAACVPLDETNLIYKSLLYFYANTHPRDPYGAVPPVTIIQEDYIPMTGGLGSSAACIVAGLLAGDTLTGGQMPREDITVMAAMLDGHPDNTTPALVGGLTVGVMADNGLIYSKITGAWEKRLKFALFIPEFTLPTEKARAVLPSHYTRQDAVFNASRTALFAAVMASGEFGKLSAAMEDRIHQPYREVLIPGMVEIKRKSLACGAYNVFLSGAGSALIAVTEDIGFIGKIRPFIETLPGGWRVGFIEPDHKGAVVDTV
jgi:homoserine kinase